MTKPKMPKKSVRDLAIFGGAPAFDLALHVGRPNTGNRERLLRRFDDMLDRKWFTNNGPYVQAFEEQLAKQLGVKHCIAVCNATVGMELAIRAVDLSGEVVVPSFTFISTAHALQWQEITPVFADIDPITHNIDPGKIERLFTPRTTGIIGVHVWGRPCEAEALQELADRHNLKLLFDAAHAYGCSYRGRMIGNLGDAEIFSFHATKFLNSLEGGAISTNNDDLAEKIRLMRNFGFSGMDNVIYIGTNGKMNEAAALMGLTSLESVDEFIAVNRRNHRAYKGYLEDLPGLRFIEYDEDERNNYQYVVIEIDERASGIDRDTLMRILHAENVLARKYFYPGCHRMEPYRSYYPNAGILLPETEKLVRQVLTLPTGTAVDENDIEIVCDTVRLALRQSDEIFKLL